MLLPSNGVCAVRHGFSPMASRQIPWHLLQTEGDERFYWRMGGVLCEKSHTKQLVMDQRQRKL
jgi:hypothetical protein